MKTLQLKKAPPLYIEIGQSSFKVMDAGGVTEFPLERGINGRLTPACAERLTAGLKELTGRKPLSGRRAFCAIGTRGVSLRRLTLPAVKKEDVSRLLALQVEREFPLPPSELAWGCHPIANGASTGPGATEPREFLVAAIRRESIQEYADILERCGLEPLFTLGALALTAKCPRPNGSYAILDIGQRHAELAAFENGVPSVIRTLPVGGDDFTRAIAGHEGISFEEAEQRKINCAPGSPAIDRVMQPVVNSLAASVRTVWTGRALYVAGGGSRLKGLARLLDQALGNGAESELLEDPGESGSSAALAGLKRLCETNGGAPRLIIRTGTANGQAAGTVQPAIWKWAAAAAALLVAAVALRYAEPLLKGPGLSQRLTEIRAATTHNPEIDRELGFLQYLNTNRPPYLEVLAAVSDAAPRGTQIGSLSMNRRGELTFQGTLQNSQQATDLRTKMIDSGLFSTVVLEEQTPDQDRRVTVRMRAQWKSPHERMIPAAEPETEPPATLNAGLERKGGTDARLD